MHRRPMDLDFSILVLAALYAASLLGANLWLITS